jgi:glycosyltransferase involved in cell wall biosynthesis
VLVSILIPVYNERTVAERSLRMVLNAPLPEGLERELIVVDDCSTDGTHHILERLAAEDSRVRLYRHEKNQGKGASVRDAIQYATGDFCLVQDADLEYDAADYPKLLRPLLDGRADAVFGSRYLPAEQTRVLPFWHSLMNKTLTAISNMFCNLALTDMETCYKVFRTDLLKSIPIRSERFGFEPEITMKVAKRKLRIYEVPISYHGRTYEEGKKIGWRDGLQALKVILYFWIIDDLYVGQYGRGFLNNLTGTPQYVRWLTDTIRPDLGDYILEIGAGIGNLSSRLMSRRFRYIATESDALYLHALENRFLRTPNVEVRRLRPDQEEDYDLLPKPLDTVVLVNVLEAAVDDEKLLACAARVLSPEGKLILVVPSSPRAKGTLDATIGNKRRYSEADLEAKLARLGFRIQKLHQLNRAGLPVWFAHSRILHSRQIPKVSLKIFDKTTWFWRLMDRVLPWPGVTMVCVADRRPPDG